MSSLSARVLVAELVFTLAAPAAALFGGGADRLGVPCGESEPVDLTYDEALPPPVAAFARREGRAWILYWDGDHDVPRFLAPRLEVRLWDAPAAEGEGSSRAAEARIREWIDRNADLLGVSAADFSPAEVLSVRGGWNFVFGQEAGGIPVRGASLRVAVAGDGRLLSAKSYLSRGAAARWTSMGLGPEHLVSQAAVEGMEPASGLRLVGVRLEIVFPEGSLGGMRPAWRLWLEDGVGDPVEEVLDAQTMHTLGAAPLSKRFTYRGVATCYAAGLDDIFSQPEELESDLQLLPGVVITNDLGEGLAAASAQGTFVFESDQNPETMVVSLAYAFSIDGCERAAGPACGDLTPCVELAVKPLDATIQPVPACAGCVGPALDFDADCVPDHVETRGAEAGAFLRLNRFAEVGRREEAERFSWWLLLFAQAQRVLRSARDPVSRQVPGFERFGGLTVRPVETLVPGSIASVPRWSPRPGGRGQILATRRIAEENAASVPLMATLVGHEVAHHVAFNLHGLVEVSDVDEAVADAMVVLANGDPRIGFLRPDERGPFGFVIGEATPFVSARRAALGGALWRAALEAGGPRGGRARAFELIVRLLVVNRGLDPRDRAWSDGACILDELLCANAALDDEPAVVERTADALRRGLADPFFHQGSAFVRGDANLDLSIQISDPITVLSVLFGGAELASRDCGDAMDADDDGQVTISDAIYVLRYLYMGGPPPLAPFPACGIDPGSDDGLCCFEAPRCSFAP